jgi:hypothetical protein
MPNMSDNQNNFYEIKFKLLGHEIFELSIGTSVTSNKWIAIGSVFTFAFLVLIGAFGEKFISLYKLAFGG